MLAAIAMCKDEADIIDGSVRHMAGEVDSLIVADNGSTDGTREILAELEDELPLTVLDDPEIGYYQSAKMSALAARAGGMGATWVLPWDIDELWFSPHERISVVLAELAVDTATAALTNHFATAVDIDDPDPFRSLVWRQPKPAPLPKVAFRWEPGAVIHQGNHGVTRPSGGDTAKVLEIRHFPYRTVEQFIHKARVGARAYRATDLPLNEGAHWRSYGDILDRLGEEGLAEVWREWFWFLSPTDAGLIRDPAPYCRWSL